MRKKFYSSPLRVALFALVGLILSSLVSSCSKDKTDVGELLASVPADASAVAAFNIKSIVEKAGCKIDGSKIIPGKEVNDITGKIEADDAKSLKEILNGETGIDPTAAVFFIEGNNQYLTGFLADPNKFKTYIQKTQNATWASENGIEKAANIAVKSNQFWIRTSHNNDIDTQEIDRFSSLTEKLSFLSNPYAPKLTSIESDFQGWGNISSLYSASGMGFQEKTMAGIALAMLFSDAQDLAFSANFEKGKFVSTLNVLNSKGDPAKFNLPVERIDPGMIKSLTPSAEMVMGIAISPKLTEQIKNEFGKNSVPGSEIVVEALSSVDGTCLVAMDKENVKGVISTNGNASSTLADLISQSLGATVTKDGKLLNFAKGLVAGSLETDKVASMFKGTMFAIAASGSNFSAAGAKNIPVSTIFAALVPADGSMKVSLEVIAPDQKDNFLISILKGI